MGSLSNQPCFFSCLGFWKVLNHPLISYDTFLIETVTLSRNSTGEAARTRCPCFQMSKSASNLCHSLPALCHFPQHSLAKTNLSIVCFTLLHRTAKLDVRGGISDPGYSHQRKASLWLWGFGGGFSPHFLLIQGKLTTHSVLINILYKVF